VSFPHNSFIPSPLRLWTALVARHVLTWHNVDASDAISVDIFHYELSTP